MPTHALGELYREARPFPELLSVFTDPGLEITQVTTDQEHDAHAAAMHSSHGLFTPDGRRFIFYRQRGAGAGGPGQTVLTLCEIAHGFALRDLTDEDNVRGPILSRDGRYLYYFVDEGALPQPRLVLKRLDLDSFARDTLLVVDTPVEGVGRVPRGGRMYDGSSLSRDGRSLSTSCSFYADNDPAYASLIVDLEKLTVRGFQFEKYNWRPFGTYYRGDDPRYFRHLLFCHSHWHSGMGTDGKWYQKKSDDVPRVTMHILTDEGQPVAVVPIGKDGEGVDHPCWRGGAYEVVTHTGNFTSTPYWRGTLLSAAPLACQTEDQYRGALIPGARRVELTRYLRRPDVCHHSWDASGTHVVCDSEGWHHRGLSAYLWLGTVVTGADGAPALVAKHLLHPLSHWSGSYWTECQPALAPDLKTVFFNTDFCAKDGHPQLVAVRGFTFPAGAPHA